MAGNASPSVPLLLHPDLRTASHSWLLCILDIAFALQSGDPIEAGAATAVLKGGVAAVHFTAAKSHMGHAEPAAGAVGILQVRRAS